MTPALPSAAPLAVTLVVVGALVLSVVGGWLFTVGMLRAASRTGLRSPRTGPQALPEDPEERARRIEAQAADAPDGPRARTVLRGGTWIGVLERLAVTGSLLLGQPEGVAVVVAVKGLGRYPELQQNPVASERFVIGTLASLVWSAAVGIGVRALLVG
ncbi:hypothetical protein [Cellulomonas marina]|uniref:Uncharacterized protein n=1 Tax=Cellulomonas marina TaxID=988821 RepID=A0A1I0W7R0_9CELL|nr:hypothetical protein [Cellulomonas marina]GIG29118.1 hypothetical protein Cma02nite_17180 [Cellulomonas marina]SFA84775.1 hypothetical protein SAMN05421867_102262 [Cellulomonas marina]